MFVIGPVGASLDAPAVLGSLGTDLENRVGEVRSLLPSILSEILILVFL